ncbi:MAG: diacylglycerol kinase [bacterium]|nr:diacylglycerol kinase [bacterium]
MVQSFNYALAGIVYGLRTQKHMRAHFIIAFLIFTVTLFLDLSRIELVILFFSVALVLVSEMINTAIESILDLITEDHYHTMARIGKDVSAGAVLVASLNAIIVGYLILYPHFSYTFENTVINKVRQIPGYIVFISLILVVLITIIGKIYIGRGTPMQGGMPSGHSAIAFSIWTSIAFITKDPLIIVLTFLLAILLGRSRIGSGFHNNIEVAIGAALGVLVTSAIFLILR